MISNTLTVVSDPLAGAQFSRTCTPCDSNCKSCIFDSRKCTSCFDGYKFNDTICFSNYAVGFELELGNNFNFYPNLYLKMLLLLWQIIKYQLINNSP